MRPGSEDCQPSGSAGPCDIYDGEQRRAKAAKWQQQAHQSLHNLLSSRQVAIISIPNVGEVSRTRRRYLDLTGFQSCLMASYSARPKAMTNMHHRLQLKSYVIVLVSASVLQEKWLSNLDPVLHGFISSLEYTNPSPTCLK